jgi:hypothetical protein
VRHKRITDMIPAQLKHSVSVGRVKIISCGRRIAKRPGSCTKSATTTMARCLGRFTSICTVSLNSPLAATPDAWLTSYPGLHADEAVDYLDKALRKHEGARPTMHTRPVYAITGTGHHSKNGKDKIGKAIRAFLSEWRYAFREFSVPGDRGNMGGIIGIDPSSWDRSLERERSKEDARFEGGRQPPTGPGQGQSTKVMILKKEDVVPSADAGGDSS